MSRGLESFISKTQKKLVAKRPKAEKKLNSILKRALKRFRKVSRLYSNFQRQWPIRQDGRVFFVDYFVLLGEKGKLKKFAIEVDGPYHDGNKILDAWRELQIEKHYPGIQIIRIKNLEVERNAAVLLQSLTAIFLESTRFRAPLASDPMGDEDVKRLRLVSPS